MKPNIFRFATSELSQDAVFSWLLAWADPAAVEVDPQLGSAGTAFLSRLFHALRRALPVLKSVEVHRQYEDIDVLAVVNASIAIVVEDKVGTSDSTAKLRRYVDRLTALTVSYPTPLRFPSDSILPVYIQTRDQSSYSAVTAAGYTALLRADVLEVLRPYEDTAGSDILRDFVDHLARIEAEVCSFATMPLNKAWPRNAWHGFFHVLQDRLGGGDWGYVANPTGGFVGFWWHFVDDSDATRYLQLEEGGLAVRIAVNNGINPGSVRSRWHERIIASAQAVGLPLVRPGRFGHGRTMTVATHDGDYRVSTSRGTLDLEATIALLKAAESVLDGA